jgi:uncharacterized membrane protein
MREKNDELVESYLDRLERELHDVPGPRRREVVDEVRGHIVEARAELATESEAEIRNILERLGEPSEIAAEARARFGIQPQSGGNWREVSAIVLLLLGGFVVVGWIVGVILLWISERWTLRDKLIGTLVVPGGLFSTLFALSISLVATGSTEACVTEIDPQTGAVLEEACTGGTSTGDVVQAVVLGALLLFFVVGPFFTTIYLALRLRKTAPPPATLATPTTVT